MSRYRAIWAVGLLALLPAAHESPHAQPGLQIERPDRPRQFRSIKQLTGVEPQLIQVRAFIRADEARKQFGVDGSGLAVAVLDTGLRATHRDFGGGKRVPAQANFVGGASPPPALAPDGQGHGTNVGGIIVANGENLGIAPQANIVPLKVLDDNGDGNFESVARALEWVVANHQKFGITVVNMSLGAPTNAIDDTAHATHPIRLAVQKLAAERIPVVVAAGNAYFKFQQQGMAFPAVLRETISVGAVYDADGGAVPYGSGARANSRAAGRLTPFSQRLHPSAGAIAAATRTDIFAPGAPVTSTGIDNDQTAVSTQHGTSQAAPVTSGVILLMQHLYRTKHPRQERPTVAQIEEWLRAGSFVERDGDDEDDNVPHTQQEYPRIDALKALEQVAAALSKPPA